MFFSACKRRGVWFSTIHKRGLTNVMSWCAVTSRRLRYRWSIIELILRSLPYGREDPRNQYQTTRCTHKASLSSSGASRLSQSFLARFTRILNPVTERRVVLQDSSHYRRDSGGSSGCDCRRDTPGFEHGTTLLAYPTEKPRWRRCYICCQRTL